MNYYLITDGFSFNDEGIGLCLPNAYGKIYVCGYDPSRPFELQKVTKCINERKVATIADVFASLCKIVNEQKEDAVAEITFLLTEDIINQTKEIIDKQLLYAFPWAEYVFVPYKAPNIQPQNIEPSKKEEANTEKTASPTLPTPAEIKKEPVKEVSKKSISRKRTRAIKDIVGDTKLKWEGRRIPDEVLSVMDRIFSDENHYTNAEICAATKLSADFIANTKRKIRLSKEKENTNTNASTNIKEEGTETSNSILPAINPPEDTPVDLEKPDNSTNKIKKPRTVKKDATTLAREERAQEIAELSKKFASVFTKDGKTLTPESHEQFRSLFIDPKRNWRVSEISEATGLKKSFIDKLLNNEPDNNKEVPSLSLLMECEADAYRDKMDYDIFSLGSVSNVSLSGNIIQDAADVIGVDKFNKDDENCLIVAFGKLGDFDTDFLDELSRGNFTYINEAQKLKDIFNNFKRIRYANSKRLTKN